MSRTRFLLRLASLTAGLAILPSGLAADAPSFHPGKIHILLVGDSTVTDSAGWGKGFAEMLNDDSECINFSKGGRSSRSYIAEGSWKKALDLHPDYVLIQFGHNDQPGHGDRETDPQTTYRQYMNQYVNEARANGIKPILVTSLSRRQWGGDEKIHSTLQPWADAVKRIGAEKNVPVLDLHARSITLYESLGKEKVLELSPLKNADPKNPNADTAAGLKDGTHLNEKGGQIVGQLVAQELARVVPELAGHIKSEKSSATSEPSATHAPEIRADCVVAPDGSGKFKTIQDAIAAAPENSQKKFVIRIKPGTYQGPVVIPQSKPNLALVGDDIETTVITWDRNVNDPIPEGADKFNPGVTVLANDFSATNLTIENTSGDHGQALALRMDGDCGVLKHCRLTGWQDTLMINNGRFYFEDCYIEGRVDFIYGSATAVFKSCEIHSKNGGYLTAASTPQDHPFGFVFMNCKLTGDGNPWVDVTGKIPPKVPKTSPRAYLGRPWRPYASVTYLNCEMGDHIVPEGWHNWGKVENQSTARYAEFGSTGPGATPEKRVAWGKKLTKGEADAITVESVLGGADHWIPE